MGRKTIIFLLLLIVSPIVIYLLLPTDEARIKKLIRQSINAIGKEDIDEVMSNISFNYQDDYGMSYALLKRALTDQFNFLGDIEIEYENLSVTVNDDKASLGLDVRVIATQGQSRGYYIGGMKDPGHLVLELEKGPLKNWLVIRASGLRDMM